MMGKVNASSSPQAWGFADVPSTQDQVFVGDTAPPKFLTTNQKLALVADKLHIKLHAGTPLIEQIREKIDSGPQVFRLDEAGNEAFYHGPAGGIVSSKKTPFIPKNLVGDNVTGVNLDGLADQLMSYVGAKPPPGKPQFKTAGQIATQIAFQSTPDQLAALQKQLFEGGFYDQSINDGTYAYTPGHTDQWTTQAIGHLLSYTAALNKTAQGAGMTWSAHSPRRRRIPPESVASSESRSPRLRRRRRRPCSSSPVSRARQSDSWGVSRRPANSASSRLTSTPPSSPPRGRQHRR